MLQVLALAAEYNLDLAAFQLDWVILPPYSRRRLRLGLVSWRVGRSENQPRRIRGLASGGVGPPCAGPELRDVVKATTVRATANLAESSSARSADMTAR